MRYVATFAFCAFYLLASSSVEAGQWYYSGHYGDWPGKDYACTEGTKPKNKYCSSTKRKVIAVCWDNRPTGYPDIPDNNCQGANEWCVYKSNVNINGPAGGAPGKVFFCVP